MYCNALLQIVNRHGVYDSVMKTTTATTKIHIDGKIVERKLKWQLETKKNKKSRKKWAKSKKETK